MVLNFLFRTTGWNFVEVFDNISGTYDQQSHIKESDRTQFIKIEWCKVRTHHAHT